MSSWGPIIISKRLVVINSASSVLNRILSVTILVWMYQYLIKSVPTEEFAIYPVVMAVMVFAPLFFSLFTGGITRYVIDAYAKSDFELVSAMVSSVIPLLAIAVGLFWSVGAGFALNIEKILTVPPSMVGQARIMMALLIFTFGVQMLMTPFMLGFHIKQRFVELNVLEVGREIFRITLLLILLFGIGPKIVWVVVANTLAEILHTLIAVIRSHRMVPELKFDYRLFRIQHARRVVSFGLWITLGQLGGVMYTNAATIILNLYGTAIDVTSYFLGATLYRQVEMMIIRAVGPLLPVITAMNASQDKVRLASTVLRGGRYGLWASMLVAVPATIYSDDFVTLYVGSKFSQAPTVIILFMVMFPFTQATSLLPLTAIAMAWVREFYLPAFFFQLLGLVLMLFLTIRFEMGAIGVTVALSLITIGAQLIYFWRLTLRMIEVRFDTFVRRVLVPGLIPAVVGALIWGILKLTVVIDSWTLLIFCGALGAFAYASALMAFALEESAKKQLIQVFVRAGRKAWMRER